MNTQDLMAKAVQAATSAADQHATSHEPPTTTHEPRTDGACNRAYYAMFDAALAALRALTAPVEPEIAKTHNGLISAFSLHLVKPGRVPVELGKALNKAEELRLIADHKGDPIDMETAAWAVAQAQTFVQAMQSLVLPEVL